MHLVVIGIGGFAGAVARYLVDGLVTDRSGGGFPWGTLVVHDGLITTGSVDLVAYRGSARGENA
jgi:fluoride ion exporter CrcB/FEX